MVQNNVITTLYIPYYKWENLPFELLINFCEYLPLREQAQFSLVCRRWGEAVTDSSLMFGLILAVFKRAVATPTITIISNSPQQAHPSSFSMGNILIPDLQNPSKLSVINSRGSLCTIDLQETLDEDEKTIEALKIQHLRNSILLSSDTFLTATKIGTVSLWKISENTIQCTTHIQCFNQKQLKKSTINRIALLSCVILNNKLCVKLFSSRKKITTLSVFDLDLTFRSSEVLNSPKSIIISPRSYNSKTLFCVKKTESKSYFLQSFQLNCQNTLVEVQSEFFTKDENIEVNGTKLGNYRFCRKMPRFQEARIEDCNERWVIVGNYFQDNPRTMGKQLSNILGYFHLFDTATCHEVFKFQYDFSHLEARFDSVIKSCRPHWLCGDFFVIWDGRKLAIWHLLAKRYLTSINLESFCAQKTTVSNVNISKDVLKVTLTNPEGGIQVLNFIVDCPNETISS